MELISKEAAINTVFSMLCKWDTEDPTDLKNMLLLAFQEMPSAQPEQKSDIEEAVEYIKNAQEYLRDIGETWCANYLSDAIELLAGEKRGEEDETDS